MSVQPSQSFLEFLRNLKPLIFNTAQKYGVSNIRIFGSAVRNEMTPTSDVDLLVHVDRDSGLTLFALARLEEELEQLIGRPVDVVLDDALSPSIRERILQEVHPL